MFVPASSILSEKEIAEEISSLSDAGRIRLSKIADLYCRGIIDSKDLLQEAFLRALDGRRKCPRDIDLVRFLAETMRSLASSYFKSSGRSPELLAISSDDDADEPGFDPPSDRPDPENAIISQQESAAFRSAILSLFKDDEIAQIIVEGDMEGMEANELYDLTHLDKTAFASKRRMIRRRIERAFPEGWKI